MLGCRVGGDGVNFFEGDGDVFLEVEVFWGEWGGLVCGLLFWGRDMKNRNGEPTFNTPDPKRQILHQLMHAPELQVHSFH